MKVLIEFLVGTGMLTFFLIVPQANGAPPNSIQADIRTVQVSEAMRQTMAQLSPRADKVRRLERVLVSDARGDKWWMAFVGITLVGYRLLRKHQALFADSLLYGSYAAVELRAVAGIDSQTSELEPVRERMVSAS